MADFKQIDQARRMLGLGEEATIEEIRNAYRRLALKYHPDRCKGQDRDKCEEMFKKITRANETLIAYCAGYKHSFKEKDVKKNIMGKYMYEHIKRFYDGWWDNMGM